MLFVGINIKNWRWGGTSLSPLLQTTTLRQPKTNRTKSKNELKYRVSEIDTKSMGMLPDGASRCFTSAIAICLSVAISKQMLGELLELQSKLHKYILNNLAVT
jgi:hypothetical protein